MPERKVSHRVETPDIQGDDSYIVLRPMTVGEVLSLQRNTERSAKKRRGLRGLWARMRKKQLTQADIYESFVKRVLSYIADWNWVDDHGQPLPKPREDAGVAALLTNFELEGLIGIIYGTKESEDEKN
jgi:hypothetical protein